MATTTINVPPYEAPVIDGVLAAGEWDGAAEVAMSDDSSIYAMYRGETLYVAVRAGRIGSINLAIATESEVWILHSSAALGSARYLPEATSWELEHGFEWCCRSSTDDSERRSLQEREGWQANIGFTGDPGVVEFLVDLPWKEAVLAISSVTDTSTAAFWPAELSPDARHQLIGTRRPEVDFNLDEWIEIIPLEE